MNTQISPQEIIKKFGLELRDDTSFCVAKRTWDRFVGITNNTIVSGRPNEGDILYFPLQKSFYEIQFVEDQEPFFQLNNLPVYKLKVSKWEYNSEIVSTSNSEINDKASAASIDMLNYQFSLEAETGSILLEGDTINYLINESYAIQTQSTYADNTTFETASGETTSSLADDILDFTERNPFGEVD